MGDLIDILAEAARASQYDYAVSKSLKVRFSIIMHFS